MGRASLFWSIYVAIFADLDYDCVKWAVASLFILFVGMSMGELGSAAPTSGGVRLYPLQTAWPVLNRSHLAVFLDALLILSSVSKFPRLDRRM